MSARARLGLWLAVSLAVVGAVAMTIAACGGAGFYVEHDVVTVTETPPEPRVEILEVPPGPGYVWAQGHWIWTGEGFAWVEGRWARPPAPGFVWVPGGWVRFEGRYRFVTARWAHHDRIPHFAYLYPHDPPDEALSPLRPKAKGSSSKCAPTHEDEPKGGPKDAP